MLFEFDEEAFVVTAEPRLPKRWAQASEHAWSSRDLPVGYAGDPAWPVQLVPTRLRIGEVDLLGRYRSDGVWVPWHQRVDVLYTARWGMVCLRQCRIFKRVALNFAPEYNGPTVRMVQYDDFVLVNVNGHTVQVSYDLLCEHWQAFANRVRELLHLLTPEFANPEARRWYREERRIEGSWYCNGWTQWLSGIEEPDGPKVSLLSSWDVNQEDLVKMVEAIET